MGDIIRFDIPRNDGQVLDLDDASAFLSDLQIEDARTIVDNLLPPGDFDGNADGMVDDADLALWRQYFGFVSNSIGTAVSAAAPEPTALSLRLAGIAFCGFTQVKATGSDAAPLGLFALRPPAEPATSWRPAPFAVILPLFAANRNRNGHPLAVSRGDRYSYDRNNRYAAAVVSRDNRRRQTAARRKLTYAFQCPSDFSASEIHDD